MVSRGDKLKYSLKMTSRGKLGAIIDQNARLFEFVLYFHAFVL
jgi:hypothetical protein